MSKKKTKKNTIPEYNKYNLAATRVVADMLINDIRIDNVSIREIYDNAIDNSDCDGSEIYISKFNRIMVNEIRHNYSNYEEGLKQVNRMKYFPFYDEYKDAVLDSIGDAYPMLREECNRQKIPITIARCVTSGS